MNDTFIALFISIENALPPTVSIFEIAWMVPNIIGFFIFLRRWRASARNQRLLNRIATNDAMCILASKRTTMHGALTIAFEAWSLIGVLDLITPTAPMQIVDSEYYLFDIFTTLLLISVSVVLMVMGIFTDLKTRELYRYYERHPRMARTRRDDPHGGTP